MILVFFSADSNVFEGEENSTVKIPFSQPGQGTYEAIRWYKGHRRNRVAFYKEGLNGGQVLYQGDFCPEEELCLESSPKGQMDTATGELTIYSAELSDDDYYFYDFFNYVNTNTGHDYQIYLVVYSK